MPRKRLAAGLLSVVVLLLPPLSLGAEGPNLAFNWAFVHRAADGSFAVIDFSERVTIRPGELFKIALEPLHSAYIYLYLHDAAGDLSLLFPPGFETFERDSYEQTRYFIPGGEDWFQLDSTKGTERLYLLASAQRLKDLERLSSAYLVKKGNPQSASADVGAARQAVLDEIVRVRRQHSQLTIAAEKPVTVAGGTRGMSRAVEDLATRIEASEFYTRTFRLDH
ncbi:MAG: DUF4384 domain-containing protein [Spirochaetia bacterium]